MTHGPLVINKERNEQTMMYYGKLDECLYRMLKAVGIEYAVERHSNSRWSIETAGDDTRVNMGRLELIISKVERKQSLQSL